MTQTMLEKMARASYAHSQGRRIMPDWETLSRFDQEFWKESAKAALTALLEPTMAMCDVGYDFSPEYDRVFTAMIQAALNEEGKT